MIHDSTGEQTKGAQKGIGIDTKIEYEEYLKTLYSTKPYLLPQARMQFSKKYGTMTIQNQYKAGLNPIYTKLYTHDDLVTVSPLKRDGKYI